METAATCCPAAGTPGASAAAAEPGVSGRPRGAMIYYTAVPASGASGAPVATAGRPGPRPRPQRGPRHKQPARGPPRPEPNRGTPHTPAARARAAPGPAAPSLLAGAPPPPRSPPAWPPRVARPRLRGRPQTPQTEIPGGEPRGPDSPNHLHLHSLCNVLQVSRLEAFGMGAHDRQEAEAATQGQAHPTGGTQTPGPDTAF